MKTFKKLFNLDTELKYIASQYDHWNFTRSGGWLWVQPPADFSSLFENAVQLQKFRELNKIIVFVCFIFFFWGGRGGWQRFTILFKLTSPLTVSPQGLMRWNHQRGPPMRVTGASQAPPLARCPHPNIMRLQYRSIMRLHYHFIMPLHHHNTLLSQCSFYLRWHNITFPLYHNTFPSQSMTHRILNLTMSSHNKTHNHNTMYTPRHSKAPIIVYTPNHSKVPITLTFRNPNTLTHQCPNTIQSTIRHRMTLATALIGTLWHVSSFVVS